MTLLMVSPCYWSLANGRTTIERRGGADFSAAGSASAWAAPDLQRVDPDRFGDVERVGPRSVTAY